MTSEPSAEPTMSMPGASGSSTAGSESLTGTEQMVTGKPGILPDLGSLKHNLRLVLTQSGIPEESIADTAQGLTLLVRQWFLEWLASCTLDTATPKTEPSKPKSTSTSESQNEEVG